MAKRKGDLIFTCEPYVHVLLQSQKNIRCDSCLERNDTLKKCTACGLMKYCNVKCQREDWIIHKAECPCLKRSAPDTPLDSVRLFLRLLIRHGAGEEAVTWPGDPGWSTFSHLMSHKTEIQNDSTRSEYFCKLLFTIMKIVGPSFHLPDKDTLLELFGKMTINTFTICDGECQAIGSGVYLSAAKLDHSCCPNAVAVFRGKTLHLRAVRDIDDPTPKQLTISYIDQLSPSQDRREELQAQYYFWCDCHRCASRQQDDQMLSFRCSDDTCSGMVFTEKGCCQSCGKVSVNSSRAWLVEAKDSLQTIEACKKKGAYRDALGLCQDWTSTHLRHLHDRNVYQLRRRDQAFDTCIQLQMWGDALRYGQSTGDGFREYYPENSPIVGVQLMKIGKLELFLQKLNDALTHLEQARAILVVTHGRDHPLVEELLQLIDQCQEEMRIELEKSQKHPV